MSSEPRRGHSQATWGSSVFILALLSVVPLLALHRLSRVLDGRLVVSYFALISLVTYYTYRSDKERAKRGEQRTPENTLHLLESLGGWPAAFLAQRFVRHKIAKRNYQIAFCAIIIVHEYVAVDFLLEWRLTMTAFLRYVEFFR